MRNTPVDPNELSEIIYRQANKDICDLEKWFFDAPFLIGKELQDQFDLVSRCMARLVRFFAENAEIWTARYGLDANARRVLSFWRDVPYDPGTYRTDFVFSDTGLIRLIEVTCRFAMNGYAVSAQQDLIARKTPKGRAAKAHWMEETTGFFRFLAKAMGAQRDIIVLTGSDLRNESRFLERAFEDTEFTFSRLPLNEVPQNLDRLETAFIYSELSLEELGALPDAVLEILARRRILNDPRTSFFVHDKAFFAFIYDVDLLNSVLGQDAVPFQRHILPCYLRTPETADIWEQAKSQRTSWILKHRTQGKSQEIYAGVMHDDVQWQRLFEGSFLDNFVLQKFEPQKRYTGFQSGQLLTHYVAGTLLLADGRSFGPGEFRTCENPVSNTGEFRKISCLLTDTPTTDYNGTWI